MINYNSLAIKANWLRRTVLEMGVKAKSGHVTTAFSLAELFVALYHGKILRFDSQNPKWEDRDRFILSEGQAGLGLYPVLADVGFFPLSDLDNFLGDGSTLGVHSEPSTKGIDVLTGSLGHGLPIATGMADAAKIDGKSWLTICLTGDGELYEGSNDRNESQRDVLLDPLPEKLKAFGFEVRIIDGHNFSQIFNAFADMRKHTGSGLSLAIIADTIKGKGSKELENKRGWHYKVPSGEILESVRVELEKEKLELETKGDAI